MYRGHVYIYIYIQRERYIYIYTCVYTRVCIYIYIYVYIRVCMCIYVCVYIYSVCLGDTDKPHGTAGGRRLVCARLEKIINIPRIYVWCMYILYYSIIYIYIYIYIYYYTLDNNNIFIII